MGTRVSTYVIQWINFITMLISLAVLAFGVFLATKHGNCEKFLTAPVLILGGFIFVISFIGFVGALKDITILLWLYLFLMFVVLAAIAAFTVFAFIITNSGAGHAVRGQGFKDYRLGDYSHWLQKRLNNTKNWEHLKSCFVKTKYCDNLIKEYKTLKAYKQAQLTPIESGCCRPPSECDFPARNASYYDLSFKSQSSNRDCKLYKNNPAVKCYNCDSCKAGVAQYLKKKWRFIAIFNIVVFVLLILLYSVGCCARRNASDAYYSKM